MKVTVKIHGEIKTVIGKDAIDIELPEGSILKDLFSKIFIDYKKIGCQNLEQLINSYIVLRGSHIIRSYQVLSEKDELNIFPYIEGG